MFSRKINNCWDQKTQVEMNKSVYLEFAIPDVCKVQMYEFCYDFI